MSDGKRVFFPDGQDEPPEVSILILGDCETGKSCLARRYALGKFTDQDDDVQSMGSPTSFEHEGRSVRIVINDLPGGPCRTNKNVNRSGLLGECNRAANNADVKPRSNDLTDFSTTSIPLAPVLGPDTAFESFREEYRRSAIQRSDAVIVIFNPWRRETFQCIENKILREVAEGSQKKYLGKRVARLLDGLSRSMARQGHKPRPKSNVSVPRGLRAEGLWSRSVLTVVESQGFGGNIHRDKPGEKCPSEFDTASKVTAAAVSPISTISLVDESEATKTDRDTTPTPPLSSSTCRRRTNSVTPHINLEVYPHYPVILVGAQSDKLEEHGGIEKRQVSVDEATALARRFGPRTAYIEASALSGQNVDFIFTSLLCQVLQVWNHESIEKHKKNLSGKLWQRHHVYRRTERIRFWKKVACLLATCFGNDRMPSSNDRRETSKLCIQDAHSMTITNSPCSTSTKNFQRRYPRAILSNRSRPPCTQIADSRSKSGPPTLLEIQPLPKLTLDSIAIAETAPTPLLPNIVNKTYDSVSDKAPERHTNPPTISRANTTSSTLSIDSMKSFNSLHYQGSRDTVDKTFIRTGRVVSHNVTVSSASAVAGSHTKSIHGSIAGGMSSHIHSTPSQRIRGSTRKKKSTVSYFARGS